MLKANVKNFFSGPVPALLMGVVLGSGSVWSFFESNRRDTEIQIDRLRLSSEMGAKLFQMQDDSLEMHKKRSEYLTDAAKDGVSPTERESLERSADELYRKLELLADNATAIELQLANIEGRTPRDLAVMTVFSTPLPPPSLTVK